MASVPGATARRRDRWIGDGCGAARSADHGLFQQLALARRADRVAAAHPDRARSDRVRPAVAPRAAADLGADRAGWAAVVPGQRAAAAPAGSKQGAAALRTAGAVRDRTAALGLARPL